jgi:hypothetical protein
MQGLRVTGRIEDPFWTNVYCQRFTAAGAPVGGETLASTTTWGHQAEPDVAMAADGSFVVVWTEELIVIGPNAGGYREVRRRQFDSAAVPLADEENVSQLTTEAILGQRFAAGGTRRGLLPW